MHSAHAACLGLAALAMLSCSSVAPVKVSAGDQCFRCRRYIHDERVAAEAIDGNRFVSRFRGPGCMAKYLVAHPDDRATLYVTDYTSGQMIAPARAMYVPEVVDRNTGEVDYRAYRDTTDAVAFATEAHAVPIAWNAVLEQAR
jgi:hypothetical protein